nr:mediator of RNA polymerase II transcription subunit 23 isoform X1 [Onthophagus taurus]
MTDSLNKVINDILYAENVQEAFACFVKHRPENDENKKKGWVLDLTAAFKRMNQDQTEAAIKHYLTVALTLKVCSESQLQLLLELLERLIRTNALPARLVCEQVITFEQLQMTNSDFWMQCFKLILNTIDLVEYKGVREIMRGCCEKAKTIPNSISVGQNPLMMILTELVRKIMDRDQCLLPGYLLVNELQKSYSEFPHWRLSGLFIKYIESFRFCAQMVSVIGHGEMRPVVEHSGCPEHLVNPWKLDPITLRYTIKGTLPYEPDVLQKQSGLLRYVIEQPYSRDMVCGMLGLQKQHRQHCAALEEQIIELVILAMDKSENDVNDNISQGLWLHLSSQLIYFILFYFANFQNIVLALVDRLQGKEYKRGRDQLMWVLLQFISGAIHRNPLSNFLPVLKLYELFYPEDETPPAFDVTQPQCTRQMAMTCTWIHLTKKAQVEGHPLQNAPIPKKLRAQYEFLQHLLPPGNAPLTMGPDYRIILLCNAYSTNQDVFSKPMAALVESVQGSKSPTPPSAPLSMAVLDSLTIHSKMSLIHSIVTHVMKLAQQKAGVALAPALVETYSRLLVYTEIESLGIKGFISQLLPTVYKAHAWATLYTLLEMFSYRIHHIHPHYRVQLLSHLHSLAAGPQANHTQLHLCVESTALRLITGLGSGEVQPKLSSFLSEPKTLVSAESEELNRVLVLTLARATHVTGADGSWCTELLASIAQSTPHAWAAHTLECFPEAMAKFFQQHPVPKENKPQLKKAIDEEYRKWASMNNENDILAHFGVPSSPPLFLCLLWKMLLETEHISPIAYKILERIGARALSAHLRKFCDCLVFEFTNSAGGQHVNKCVDTINEMIWKYNIVTIDRLVLCLALRTQEGSEAQVCSFLIQLVLLKAYEFRNRVQDFVKDNTPDHWNQMNWHEKHLEFHRKYPEKFAPDETSGEHTLPKYNPYFGNVCLRFLPVFDIITHRFLEIPQVTKSLEILLEHLGCLYKFHDRPVTHLYNTLHYYERKLWDRPPLKKKLVAAVLGAYKEILSEQYQLYLNTPADEIWEPNLDYFVKLVKRVVDTLSGVYLGPIAGIDWRFNEFANAGAHILYTTCAELLALPSGAVAVANNLLDVITKGFTVIPQDQIHKYINAIGLILTALPTSYWSILLDRLYSILMDLQTWKWTNSPYTLFNFTLTHSGYLQNRYSHHLALAHSIWHHAAPGQMATVPTWIKDKLPPIIQSEYQLLYICHLIGPFLARIVTEIVVPLYELVAQVDQAQEEWKYLDPICDFLYHIKYMFVGDSLKKELEVIVRKLRPKLQKRLRFIVNLDEIVTTPVPPPPPPMVTVTASTVTSQ